MIEYYRIQEGKVHFLFKILQNRLISLLITIITMILLSIDLIYFYSLKLA